MNHHQLAQVVLLSSLLSTLSQVQANVCAGPGIAGDVTASGVVNTYWQPAVGTYGDVSAAIPISAPRGADTGTPLAEGDYVLLIQMQCADINTSDTASYGDGNGTDTELGSPLARGYSDPSGSCLAGNYEFVRAGPASSAVSLDISDETLMHTYVQALATNTTGRRTFQVVRVPQYDNLTIDTVITAPAWDAFTGGVVALDAATTLTLNGTIDVDGLGFHGGYARARSTSDATIRYVRTDDLAHGSKGEGIAGTPRWLSTKRDPDSGAPAGVTDQGVAWGGYPSGTTTNGDFARGAPGNAGGGGNFWTGASDNGGGGGGANGGNGGRGGAGWRSAGYGGVDANFSNLTDQKWGFGGAVFAGASIARLVLGGGGGAGDNNNNSAPQFSAGAAGGGIVLIHTRRLSGSGTITARGARAADNAQNDGAGGGGAGGSVALIAAEVGTGSVSIDVQGGRGGNAHFDGGAINRNAHGTGGGGGGGYVIRSVATTVAAAGGGHGLTENSDGGPDGQRHGARAGTAGVDTLISVDDDTTTPNAGFRCLDYGDAPMSYGLARHNIGAQPGALRLGSVSPDGDDRPESLLVSAAATSDDLDAVDDEDSIVLPSTSTAAGMYTVSVPFVNTTGTNATVCGWVDFDQNGAFETDERACNTAPNAGTSVDLAFTVPVTDRTNTGSFYARFRLATMSSEAQVPDGRAETGEVEDYLSSINTLPVTLASVASTRVQGDLVVTWTTATETGNVGFHLYGRGGPSMPWQRVTDQMVPSRAIYSLDPQSYQLGISSTNLQELLIEDWDIAGQAETHGPFRVGSTYGVDAAKVSTRIDWRAIRETNDKAPKRFTPKSNPDAILAWVDERAVYRVHHGELSAMSAAFDHAQIDSIAVTDNGYAHSRHVEDTNANGVFDGTDFIEFLGHPSQTLYSRRNAYMLTVDWQRAKAANDRELPLRNALSDAFENTVTFERQRAYNFASPVADPWYDQWLIANGGPASLERLFDLPGYAGGGARLDLRVWGITDWEGQRDHHLVVELNGKMIDEIWFDGTETPTIQLDIAASDLRALNNKLRLTATGETGFPYDIQALDGFDVRYQRQTLAAQGTWYGKIPRRAKVLVDGFAGSAVAWNGNRRRTGRSQLALRGRGTWVAVDANEIRRPQLAIARQPIVPPQHGTWDYLIVAHPQFMGSSAMVDLVSLQQSRGYRTTVVDVGAVYAAYSDFEVDAEAIRDFLAQAKPRFVLLVGADAYDYHDYLGLASQSFIPTHYTSTYRPITFAPSDNRHVDYDDDGIPDAMLGRLPVRTVQEFSTVVRKLLAWTPPRQAVLSAGLSDTAGTFSEVNARFSEALINHLAVRDISVDHLGFDQARSHLQDALSHSAQLASYVGHSSYGIWGLNPQAGLLFDVHEARRLSNMDPHLVTQWGCWNTYFVSPGQDTMANGFLFSDGGAAAVLGATALTELSQLQQLGIAFFDRYPRSRTVGHALGLAIRERARKDPFAADSLRGFALLGDPAAPLR